MSSDIYAKVDLSKKIRYKRKVKDEVEWGREQTVIDEAHQTDLQSHEDRPNTQNHHPVQTRSFREVALCLGVLCLLMMVGIIILFTCHNYTRCQKCYETLSENYSALQDEVKQLREKIEGKFCPGRWKKFGSSCYFKSAENRTWYESRADCQERGADLVIINSREEQDFIAELNVAGKSWIGLRTVKQSETPERWGWEWVDGSPLSHSFWVTGHVEDPKTYLYALCCDQRGKWTQTHNWYKTWICEKQVST